MRPADQTFATKTRAEQWLTRTEAELLAGDWIDPDSGLISFGEYATAWVEERPNLRPNTVQVYRYVLNRHLLPTFGGRSIGNVEEPHVRTWRKTLLDSGASAATAAKAYRLLKSILNTAVDDGLIRRNPCRIRGAAADKSLERPVLTVRHVYALADAIEPHYRALILLAVFASLQWGELTALRRRDVDLSGRAVTIERSLTELPGGGYHYGPPKSLAGRRVVGCPDLIVPDLTWHLARFTGSDDDSLVFTIPGGTPLRDGNFRCRVWLPTLKAAGLPPATHFHDLRHTGNHFASAAGASLRDLMDCMGHASTRAALIYQHSTAERQRQVADAVDAIARAALGNGSGTGVARRAKHKQKNAEPENVDLG